MGRFKVYPSLVKNNLKCKVLYWKFGENDELVGYADADFRAHHLDRKSVSGHLFEVNGNLVSWSFQKQSVAVLSSTEAEYISLNSVSCTRMWIKYILTELGIKLNQFKLFEDN